MDILQQIKLTTQFEKYVRKDFNNSLMVGLISSTIPILIGYGNNWENKTDNIILFIIIVLIFGSLLVYEKLKPYYIIETSKLVTNKIPYARIKGSYDFYISVVEPEFFYKCKRDSCSKTINKNIPLTYKVSEEIYTKAGNLNDLKVYILLSATKNFIGIYSNDKFYSNL